MGSFGVAFRRDYGSLLVCALFSWAASHLPFAILSTALAALGTSPFASMAAAWLVCVGAFALLMVLSLRTVFGMGSAPAAAAAALGVLGLFLLPIAPVLASPFLLYWGWQYFRGDVSDIQWSFSRRQSFKRHLQAATVNPRDAEAHYQLGLIYQQRRQNAEAIERFKKAVEIDPQETDAHYQLGRLARGEKRFTDAIAHFEEVVRRAPAHSRHEVWREIGATYAESGTRSMPAGRSRSSWPSGPTTPKACAVWGRRFWTGGPGPPPASTSSVRWRPRTRCPPIGAARCRSGSAGRSGVSGRKIVGDGYCFRLQPARDPRVERRRPSGRGHPRPGRRHGAAGRGVGGGAGSRAERGLPRHLHPPARCASARCGRAGSRWTARPPTAPTSPSTT